MKEISLYEKRQVKLEKVPLMPGMAGSYPPAAIALELVNDLSCALFVRPMVYREPGSLCVNALYPCSSFGCDDFLDEYREILAALRAMSPAELQTGAGNRRAEGLAAGQQRDL